MSIKSVEIRNRGDAGWEQAVRRAVAGIRYGSVEVLVHDGRVVQVETRRKVRFADDRPAGERQREQDTAGPADRKAGGAAGENP
jgi:hypothetical protein